MKTFTDPLGRPYNDTIQKAMRLERRKMMRYRALNIFMMIIVLCAGYMAYRLNIMDEPVLMWMCIFYLVCAVYFSLTSKHPKHHV